MPSSGYFDTLFAASGDKTAVPDAAQPDGSVSYDQGFTVDYTLPIGDLDRKTVPRAQTNQLYYDITSSLQQYQQKGVPPFITTAMNGGSPFSYSNGDRVVKSGVIYISLVDTNTTIPPGASWAIWNSSYFPSATLINLFYPVGTVYYNKTNNTNPATLFGFGTWVALTDVFLVAHGSTYTATGGSATATLGSGNLPAHQHFMFNGTTISSGGVPVDASTYGTVDYEEGGNANNYHIERSTSSGTAVANVCLTSSTGSSSPFSIIPPYQAIYAWERTA